MKKVSVSRMAIFGCAALGVVALVAAAKVRHRRGHETIEERLETAARESVEASQRATGTDRGELREDVTQTLVERAELRRPIPGNLRHEVSSLVPPVALAPDADAAGWELVDPDAIEVPLGQSADSEIDQFLTHDKVPQPDSTGAALVRTESNTEGVHIEDAPGFEERASGNQVSFQARETTRTDERYDALEPDDLGSEFLTRATQADSSDSIGDPDEAQIGGLYLDPDLSIVSEGSLLAASAEGVESAATTEPQDVDDDRNRESEPPATQPNHRRPPA